MPRRQPRHHPRPRRSIGERLPPGTRVQVVRTASSYYGLTGVVTARRHARQPALLAVRPDQASASLGDGARALWFAPGELARLSAR
jgi:hypothetical protein